MIKKEIIIGIMICFLVVSFVKGSEDSLNAKVDLEVYEELKGQENVSVIVVLEDGKRVDEVKEEIKDLEVGHEYSIINGFSGEVNEERLEELKKNPDVKKVFQNKRVFPSLDVSVGLINADDSWELLVNGTNITGKDQTVCVIDTGVDYNHSTLGGGWGNKVIGGYRYMDNGADQADCSSNNSACFDDNEHGTHVAGIIISNDSTYKGVAPDAKVAIVKALDSSGGWTSDVIAGIDWCVNNASEYNISVISMSLGDCSNHNTYCNDDSMASSINSAVGKNISVVVASGNCNSVQCPGVTCTGGVASPACVENATAVGAVDDSDDIFYQRGNLFQLLAPGIGIMSTKYPNGGFQSLSGTSMAAPHVSGVIALLQHFYNMQKRIDLSVEQVEDILNSTGVIVDDSSESGSVFSRVDVYAAILSLDSIAPNVSLISPSNNHVNLTQNQSFSCNASDWQLVNVTLEIWNSSELFYNETKNVSGKFNETSFSVANLNYDTYEWNCLFYDNQSNSGYASSNFTLIIGGIKTVLVSPANQTYGKQNETNFTCQSLSETNYELTNVSFYLWNSTELIYNETKEISGFDNSSVFNYSFEYEDNYKWNCLSFNNASNLSWGNNYTIIFDVIVPIINLISPSDSAGYSSNSQSITFSYNVSDNSIANCSLIVNEEIVSTNQSILDLSANHSFASSFSVGSYNWNVNCTDSAGNVGNSSFRSFSVSAPTVTSSSSGGGGGGGSSVNNIKTPVTNVSSDESEKEVLEKLTTLKDSGITGKTIGEKVQSPSIKRLKNIISGLLLVSIMIIIFLLFKEKKFLKEKLNKKVIEEYKEIFKKNVKPNKKVKK